MSIHHAIPQPGLKGFRDFVKPAARSAQKCAPGQPATKTTQNDASGAYFQVAF